MIIIFLFLFSALVSQGAFLFVLYLFQIFLISNIIFFRGALNWKKYGRFKCLLKLTIRKVKAVLTRSGKKELGITVSGKEFANLLRLFPNIMLFLNLSGREHSWDKNVKLFFVPQPRPNQSSPLIYQCLTNKCKYILSKPTAKQNLFNLF